MADFFRQLATYQEAGMSILRALETLASNGRHRTVAHALFQAIKQGQTFGEAVVERPSLFTPLQAQLLAAAESTGRLVDVLRDLADDLDRRHKLRSGFLLAIAYPVFVFHVAALGATLFRLLTMTTADGMQFGLYPAAGLTTASVTLGIPYAMFFILVITLRLLGPLGDTIRLKIPIIGTALRHFAIARFFRALHGLYMASVNMVEALETAAACCGNTTIGEQLRKAADPLSNGESLALAIATTGALAHDELQLLTTACETGSMDTALPRIATTLEDRAATRLKLISVIAPVLIFLFVAAGVGYLVISMFRGYLTMLESLTQ